MKDVLSYFPVSKTQGYAVVKTGFNKYDVQFGNKVAKDGEEAFEREALATSMGRSHSYASQALAENVIKREILPLYG